MVKLVKIEKKNVHIQEHFSVALIGDKLRETRLRQFGHVQSILTMMLARKVFLYKLMTPQGNWLGRRGQKEEVRIDPKNATYLRIWPMID